MTDHILSGRGSSRRQRLWLAAALVVYVILTLWLALHHEAWSDETDSWLLMRDGGVRVMLSETAYAGTPALWYLLLAPLASAGLPYLAQQLLNLLFIWCAMAIFVFDAPLNPLLKVAVLFSYYPLCEYAVQARPYALVVLLLFGIVVSWRRRDERPWLVAILVVLLANATVHGLLIAAIIGALFLGDALVLRTLRQPNTALAVALMLAGGILSVLQLRLPGGFVGFHRYVDPGTVPWSIGSAFLPRTDPRLSFAAGLLILLAAVLTIGHRIVPLLFLWMTITVLLLVFVYVWVGGLRHTGLILVVTLAGVWMAGPAPRPEPWRRKAFVAFQVLLALSMAWAIYVGALEAAAEIRLPHSGSKEMAEYIGEHVPPSTLIVAPAGNGLESILAYLPGRRFWYAQSEQFGSYIKWNALGAAPERERPITVEMTIERGRARFAGRPWLLLVAGELNETERRGFRLLYANRQKAYAVHAEQFWLYAPD